ncbi:MAG: hypothetical protein ACI4BH_02035 [Muribaculaceae bacterium]
MAEDDRYWDTLFLSITTDPEQIAYVRIMYDRDELVPGYNITRERSFDREGIDLPEIVVTGVTHSGITLRAYFEGEEDLGIGISLDLNQDPLFRLQIGPADDHTILGLEIIDIDDPIDLEEYDDDGRYDAWV